MKPKLLKIKTRVSFRCFDKVVTLNIFTESCHKWDRFNENFRFEQSRWSIESKAVRLLSDDKVFFKVKQQRSQIWLSATLFFPKHLWAGCIPHLLIWLAKYAFLIEGPTQDLGRSFPSTNLAIGKNNYVFLLLLYVCLFDFHFSFFFGLFFFNCTIAARQGYR